MCVVPSVPSAAKQDLTLLGGASMKALLRFTFLLASAAILVLPVSAQRLDKKASGLGQVNPTTGCSAGSSNTPCVVFAQSSTTQGQWTNFLFGGGQDGPYDLFTVPTTQDVTFQLTGSNVAFGSFLCGFDTTMITQLGGFCTNIADTADPATFLSLDPLLPDGSNQVTFGFNPGTTGLPADWVFYFTAGDASIAQSTVATPEPATLTLLAGGLFVLGNFKRRLRRQN